MKRGSLGIVLVLVLMGGGCQAADEPQMGPTPAEEGTTAAAATATAATATATATPSAPQELVAGAPEDTFVVEGDRANLGMFPINANIFETLVFMTPDFQLEPGLATEWAFVGDDTWRFELREGVAFHDGQPFDAEAVQFSLERLERAYGPRLSIGPESVTVVDDMTVEITTTEPNLSLPSQLVHPSIAPMVAPGTDIGTTPTGTGPFRFVEYVAQERLVVERNDDYWGEPARLDTITFQFIPDGNTRWLSLRTGEVDLIYDLPRELLPEAQTTEGIRLGFEPGSTPAGSAEIMFLNRAGEPPFDTLQDRAVRQALGHIIDRDSIVDDIWGDAAELSDTVTPTELFGEFADVIEGPTLDPGRAAELLASAGWSRDDAGTWVKDGAPLSLTLINGYPPIDLRKPMPELVQAQLQDFGIEVELIETPELGTYTDRLDNGQGDVFFERVAQNDATPAFFGRGFFYSQSDGPYARWFFAGEDFDPLLEESLAADDRELAKKAAAEAMAVAIDQEAVVIPIAAAYWLFAMTDEVRGFVPHGSSRLLRWSTVELAG